MIKCNRGVAREGPGFFIPDIFHIQPRNSSKTEKKVCARGGGGFRGGRAKENFSDTSSVSESLLAVFSSIHVHWDMVKFSGGRA